MSDASKPDLTLLYPPFLEQVARVLEAGERKYGRLDWQSLPMSRVTAAVMRHVNAINMGEDIDSDTGCQHAACVAAGAMFLSWFHFNSNTNWAGADDRRWLPDRPRGIEPNPAQYDSIKGMQRLVCNWADEALGERTYDQAFDKLDEEIEELRDSGVEGRADEMADLFIILLDMAKMANIDIGTAVMNKLEVNRKRRWEKRDGVFSHIEDTQKTFTFGFDIGAPGGDKTSVTFVAPDGTFTILGTITPQNWDENLKVVTEAIADALKVPEAVMTGAGGSVSVPITIEGGSGLADLISAGGGVGGQAVSPHATGSDGSSFSSDSPPEFRKVGEVIEHGSIVRQCYYPVGSDVKWAYAPKAKLRVSEVNFNPMTGRYEVKAFNETTTIVVDEQELWPCN